jgi:tRNA(Ile2) C34 agmatinyltransferase TiaS
MIGDIKRVVNSHCKICGASIYAVTKEGYRCFKIERTCGCVEGETSAR